LVKKGDEFPVKVLELNSEGKGVSKLDDGFVVFTDKALPGDEAMIKIRKKKSNYAEAKLINIISPSPFRIEPVCRYFGTCGGCKVMNYDYEKQLDFKTNAVKNALSKIGGFKDLFIPPAIGSENIFFFRNKMEYSFSDDEWLIDFNNDTNEAERSDTVKQGYALGLHVPGFHSKIVNIEKCFLMSEYSNEILKFTGEYFRNKNTSVYSTKSHSGFLRFLVIREGKNTGEIMVNIMTSDHDKELMNEYRIIMEKRFPAVTTLINSVTRKKAQIAVADEEYLLKGEGIIYEKLKTGGGERELKFRISAGSFFQTNSLQAEVLFRKVTELSEFKKTDNVLDLYCGGGSISLFISELVNRVTGVEVIQSAVDDANVNAKLNGIENSEFIVSDIKDFLTDLRNAGEYNKVIVDPPRSGLHPKICEILSESDFEKIIYVSCNPHTQARDLQIICSGEKYKIDKVQPLDMFPHTYHIENIVTLTVKR